MAPSGVGLDGEVDREIVRFEEKLARPPVQRAHPRGGGRAKAVERRWRERVQAPKISRFHDTEGFLGRNERTLGAANRGDPPPHPEGPDASAAIPRVPEHRCLLLDREKFPRQVDPILKREDLKS